MKYYLNTVKTNCPMKPAPFRQARAIMAFYPEVVYFILSLENRENPVLKGFKIKDGKVSKEDVKISGPGDGGGNRLIAKNAGFIYK